MWGDAVDNIPGIPGIGEKRRRNWCRSLAAWEDYSHTDKLKGKQKENVENFREQGLPSKKLATIDTQVPIEFDPKSLTLDPPNESAIKELFTELEFRTLRRVLGEEAAQSVEPHKPAPGGQMDLSVNPLHHSAPALKSNTYHNQRYRVLHHGR